MRGPAWSDPYSFRRLFVMILGGNVYRVLRRKPIPRPTWKRFAISTAALMASHGLLGWLRVLEERRLEEGIDAEKLAAELGFKLKTR